MRWTVHGERAVYASPWLNLHLVDVEIPDGPRFDYHAVRVPHAASGTVVHDPERGVLLLWRHRVVTDSWGWEVPAGRIDPGETPAEAAGREVLEETGWRPGPLTPLVSYHPASGLVDVRFHLFTAAGAERVGEPVDVHESERVDWLPLPLVRAAVEQGEVPDGLTLTALLYALQFGRLR